MTVESHRRRLAGWLGATFLDALAAGIGVCCIVLAVAVSHGSYVTGRGPLYGLDRRVLVVTGSAASTSGVQAGLPTSSLTSGDVTSLGNGALASDVTALAPTAGVSTTVTYAARQMTTDVIGTTSSFVDTLGYSVSSGRFINADDLADSTPVIVLGQTVVNALFPDVNPIGQNVEIDGRDFDVVGTLSPKGYSGSYDQDDLIITPLTTAWADFPALSGQPIDQILVRASSPSVVPLVDRQVTADLLARHDIIDPALADFTVHKQSDLLTAEIQSAKAVTRLFVISGLLFLVLGTIWLGRALRRRPYFLGGVPPDFSALLARSLSTGLVGAALGVLAALVIAPHVGSLAADVPRAILTWLGIAAGAGAGILSAALAPLIVLPGRPVWMLPAELAARTASRGAAPRDEDPVSID